jgi:hypothetical protein
MPHFKVNSRPFWDGVVMHPRGTILDIDREDYGQLLCLDFVPMDEQAKRDIEDAKRRCLDKIADDVEEVTGKRPKLKFNPLYLEERGELNPNDRDELTGVGRRGAPARLGRAGSHAGRPGTAGTQAEEWEAGEEGGLRCRSKARPRSATWPSATPG